MSIDIRKSQTKTQINLSRPYHTGPLLIDIQPNSSKSLIDIKPIRKQSQPIQIQAKIQTEKTSFQTQAIDQILEPVKYIPTNKTKTSTLDFEKLHQFEDHLNPFSQVSNTNLTRDPSQIKISDQPKVEIDLKLQDDDINSKIVSLGDIKSGETSYTKISFSKWQPKIKIAPLHSRSRAIAIVDQSLNTNPNIDQIPDDETPSKVAQGFQSDLDSFKINTAQPNLDKDFDSNFFEFKAPLSFGASDIPQFANSRKAHSEYNKAERVNLSSLNNELHNSTLRKKIRRNNKLKRYSTSTLFTTIIVIFSTLFLTGNMQWMGKFGERNAQANQNTKTQKYDKWITEYNNGLYSPPGNDLDKDGLTNFEEFLINSNPINPNSCNTNATDNQNLLNLIDPVSCTPINFDTPGQLQRFENVLNLSPEFIQKHQAQKIQNQSYEQPSSRVINSVISVSTSLATVVTDILPIPNIEVDKSASPTFIEANAQIKVPNQVLPKLKESVVASSVATTLIEKKIEKKIENIEPKPVLPTNNINAAAVQNYIDQYRSYDKFDSQASNPVNADYFIDMSSRYNVPMKYVLALARSESRFGTDQYNQDGSSNRIGRHLNMYSIGLDDDGGSITYPSWEAGVDAFGRWYSKFENQGYSDCAKWRIYNPNGDYCQKIENLAGQIENYIEN